MAQHTILVCGGAGFIGSNFVRAVLARNDWRVVVLDKLTYAGSEQNIPASARVVFVRGDVTDAELVGEVFRRYRPSWVVNFAAETHVDRSIDSPEPFLHTNVVGTFRLLEVTRQYWQRLRGNVRRTFRFLQVSTDEVFGSIAPPGRASEHSPYSPRSPYAASKAAGDHFVTAYSTTYGVPVLLTHSSNNFGPYQYPEKLIPLMVLNALEARDLPVYGDGGNVRDWLYVEDHCEALLQVLSRGEPGARYNIGGGNEKTNIEVVEAICRAVEEILPATRNHHLRQRGLQQYSDLVRFVADRPGHDRRYALDTSTIERELGWRPRHDFEHALRATVRWYADNREWCRAVLAGRYDRERLGLAVSKGRR